MLALGGVSPVSLLPTGLAGLPPTLRPQARAEALPDGVTGVGTRRLGDETRHTGV